MKCCKYLETVCEVYSSRHEELYESLSFIICSLIVFPNVINVNDLGNVKNTE
jgi:hypothetical protein